MRVGTLSLDIPVCGRDYLCLLCRHRQRRRKRDQRALPKRLAREDKSNAGVSNNRLLDIEDGQVQFLTKTIAMTASRR
jgi:hypothetical protein